MSRYTTKSGDITPRFKNHAKRQNKLFRYKGLLLSLNPKDTYSNVTIEDLVMRALEHGKITLLFRESLA